MPIFASIESELLATKNWYERINENCGNRRDPCAPIIAFGIYLLVNLQGVIEPFEINTPNAIHKVLIASQGSGFKNMLVSGLVDRIKDTPTYIKVVDVTSLSEVNETDWNAVVLIHSTQFGRMQPDAREYLG